MRVEPWRCNLPTETWGLASSPCSLPCEGPARRRPSASQEASPTWHRVSWHHGSWTPSRQNSEKSVWFKPPHLWCICYSSLNRLTQALSWNAVTFRNKPPSLYIQFSPLPKKYLYNFSKMFLIRLRLQKGLNRKRYFLLSHKKIHRWFFSVY